MAKAQYTSVDGVARKVIKRYAGVDGVARNITSAYVGVGGVARQYFGGTTVGDLAVGDTIFLNIDGVSTEFLIVHQGNPDPTIYDNSCDGTWILAKDIWNYGWYAESSIYKYNESRIHTTTLPALFDKFDTDIQEYIKEVKIPYMNTSTVTTNLFILSDAELGGDNGAYDIGCVLDYFVDVPNVSGQYPKRIAYYNDTAMSWWTRTYDSYDQKIFEVSQYGALGVRTGSANNLGIRPALILDSNTILPDKEE